MEKFRMGAKKKTEKKPSSAIVLAANASKVAAAGPSRAEQLLNLIARRKARITEDFYDIGEALRELHRKKLYVPLGFASFGDMLDKRDVMSRSQASKLIAIVEAFPRDEALELGSERAYELSRLAAATPQLDSPATIVATGVKLGGRRRPAASLSVKQIATAAREARASRAADGEPDAEATAAAHAARTAQASLRSFGAKGAIVTVHKSGKEWRARIEMTVDALGLFTRRAAKG